MIMLQKYSRLLMRKKIKLYTKAVEMANVFYILTKIKGSEETKRQLRNLRLLIDVLPINESIADMTLNSKFKDFEDGLQYFSAKSIYW